MHQQHSGRLLLARRPDRYYLGTGCIKGLRVVRNPFSFLVELRGVELEGYFVSTTEDELLTLPVSSRGRRWKGPPAGTGSGARRSRGRR